MLTILAVVIISHYKHISHHYGTYTVSCVNYFSIKLGGKVYKSHHTMFPPKSVIQLRNSSNIQSLYSLLLSFFSLTYKQEI